MDCCCSNNTTNNLNKFNWLELGTTDILAAKRYYANLFGWTYVDNNIPGGTYTMIQKDGKYVGAAYQLTKDQLDQHLPTNWLPYLMVNDVNTVSTIAKNLGATVCVNPCDVLDQGKMAVMQDPTGAHFGLWQPVNFYGSDLPCDAIGSYGWVELQTNNIDRAGAFYSKLMNWNLKPVMLADTPYIQIEANDSTFGGIWALTKDMIEAKVPSHWLTYFNVANCDAAYNNAINFGGTVCVQPTDIPSVGRFAVVQDPCGGVFALFQAPTA